MFRPRRPLVRSLGQTLCVLLGSCAPEAKPAAVPAPIRVAPDPPAQVAPVEDTSPNPLRELGPDYLRHLKRRAALAVAGRLYFDPAADPVADVERPIAVPFELVVVAETERHLRVALADRGAVVLAYVPRTDIAPRVKREVRLLADPLPKPDRRTGIFLRPGAKLEVLARTPKHFRARFRDFDLDCQGYAPKSAMGQVYEPQAPTLGPRELEADSEWLTEPGGSPLPCPLSSGERLVSELGRSGDYTLVEYASSHLRLVGWVRSTRVHNPSGGGFVGLAAVGGIGHGGVGAPSVTLRLGTTLQTIRGQPVGRVLRETQLPFVALAGERTELQLSLAPWGPVRIWVDAARGARNGPEAPSE